MSLERVRSDEAVDGDAALLLERAHRLIEGLVEDLGMSDSVVAQTQVGEAGSDLFNGGPDVTTPQQGRHRVRTRDGFD